MQTNTDLTNFQRNLDKDGYAILDNFLNSQQIKTLTESFYNEFPEDLSGKNVAYTNISSDRAYRQRVYSIIKNNLSLQITSFLPEYHFRGASFFYKKGGKKNKKTKIPIHQHPIGVDESQFKSYVVWCPLVDVDENNGCMQMIKRSHKLNRFIKIAREDCNIPDRYLQLMKKNIISLPMKAGQGLIFDEKILHGSLPNLTDGERLAFFALLVPKQASVYYYHPDNPTNPTEFEIFEIEGSFAYNFDFATTSESLKYSTPDYMKSIGKAKYESVSSSMSKQEILEVLSDDGLGNGLSLSKKLKIKFEIIMLDLGEKLFYTKRSIERFLQKITN